MKITVDGHFNKGDSMDALWEMVFKLFGEVGASKTGLSLVRGIDLGEDFLVVKCFHNSLSNVRAAVAAVTEINGSRAMMRVIAISGTLRALRKKVGLR